MEASVGAAIGNLHPIIALLIALPCIVVLALWRRMEKREEAFAAKETANTERFIAMSERMITAINNSATATENLAEAIADNKQRS